MDHKKTLISAGIFAALGTSICLISGVANASLIADGSYVMTINETPASLDAYGDVVYLAGSAGNWNSSFTIGCLPGAAGCFSTKMDDDTGASGSNYSGTPNDNEAGVIGFNIKAGKISVTSFSMDTIFGTAMDDFNQYTTNPGLMTGFVDNAGLMTLTPTGRYGARTPTTNYPVELDAGI